MHAGYHRESVNNFLEIIEKGEQLRVRSREANKTRRTKVDAIIAEIRQNLR